MNSRITTSSINTGALSLVVGHLAVDDPPLLPLIHYVS